MSTTATPRTATPSSTVIADLPHEAATTRRVLERAPVETHFDWKPHPKSMSLGQLTGHLANVPLWGSITLGTTELDFAQPSPRSPEARTREALLAQFDEKVRDLTTALAEASGETLGGTWTARRGDHVVFALPRAAILRGMVVNHMIHHRGQLSVYLRLLDVPVPSIYGPSADEDQG
jgi:uncharacterized damage-inducible protein DinB